MAVPKAWLLLFFLQLSNIDFKFNKPDHTQTKKLFGSFLYPWTSLYIENRCLLIKRLEFIPALEYYIDCIKFWAFLQWVICGKAEENSTGDTDRSEGEWMAQHSTEQNSNGKIKEAISKKKKKNVVGT